MSKPKYRALTREQLESGYITFCAGRIYRHDFKVIAYMRNGTVLVREPDREGKPLWS